jgi:hypothetical protein
MDIKSLMVRTVRPGVNYAVIQLADNSLREVSRYALKMDVKEFAMCFDNISFVFKNKQQMREATRPYGKLDFQIVAVDAKSK